MSTFNARGIIAIALSAKQIGVQGGWCTSVAALRVTQPYHKNPSGTPFMMAQARHDMGDNAQAMAMLRRAASYADTRADAQAALHQLGVGP